MNEASYRKFAVAYQRALKHLRLELDFFIEDTATLSVYSVQERIKEYKSAVEKIKRMKKPLSIEEMQDIAGMRIVVSTQADIDVLVRFFTRKELGKELTIQSDKTIDKGDGYIARHLVVVVPPHYSRSPFDIFVEVQLLTLIQHTFNFLSRQWVYKAEYTLPGDVSNKLIELSKRLSEADKEVNLLYEGSIIAAQATSNDRPLTPASYRVIIKEYFGEDMSMEYAVDAVRWLVTRGYHTNGDVRHLFNDPAIPILIEKLQGETDRISKMYAEMIGEGLKAYMFLAGRIEDVAQHIDELRRQDHFDSDTQTPQ